MRNINWDKWGWRILGWWLWFMLFSMSCVMGFLFYKLIQELYKVSPLWIIPLCVFIVLPVAFMLIFALIRLPLDFKRLE